MLTEASEDGTLQRNFQGMTTGGGLDLIGVGVSSISHFLEVGFAQNAKDVQTYQNRAAENRWPAVRGKWLTKDDAIRQAVINQIYCAARIRPAEIENRAVTTRRPSGLNAACMTSPPWPFRMASPSPVSASHSRAV